LIQLALQTYDGIFGLNKTSKEIIEKRDWAICELWSCGLRVASCELRVASCRFGSSTVLFDCVLKIVIGAGKVSHPIRPTLKLNFNLVSSQRSLNHLKLLPVVLPPLLFILTDSVLYYIRGCTFECFYVLALLVVTNG